MEQNNSIEEPKKKTTKDFIVLFLAIGGLIVGLLILKYAMSALHMM